VHRIDEDFRVSTKCERAVSVACAALGSVCANAAVRSSTADFGSAMPRIAVSGQVFTQLMQPTQRSAMNSGMRGARWLKSRVAAVPGGMMLRATPRSAGSSTSALFARYASITARLKSST
jgi:hypothetical protein